MGDITYGKNMKKQFEHERNDKEKKSLYFVLVDFFFEGVHGDLMSSILPKKIDSIKKFHIIIKCHLCVRLDAFVIW